ncbi:MAG: hypothetical protein ACRC62_17525 [Microcoleus sp.]
MVICERKKEEGRSKKINCQLSTVNSQLLTLNSQLSTDKGLLK